MNDKDKDTRSGHEELDPEYLIDDYHLEPDDDDIDYSDDGDWEERERQEEYDSLVYGPYSAGQLFRAFFAKLWVNIVLWYERPGKLRVLRGRQIPDDGYQSEWVLERVYQSDSEMAVTCTVGAIPGGFATVRIDPAVPILEQLDQEVLLAEDMVLQYNGQEIKEGQKPNEGDIIVFFARIHGN